VVDPATMRHTARPAAGAALAAAVRIGKIRLLDNVLIDGSSNVLNVESTMS
jgi:pantothenate synthetase